jgi:hypothetical protein
MLLAVAARQLMKLRALESDVLRPSGVDRLSDLKSTFASISMSVATLQTWLPNMRSRLNAALINAR